MIKGNVDAISNHLVRGWCFDSESPLQAITIALYLDNELLIEELADRYRGDLINKIHSTGKCGFAIQLPTYIQYEGQHLELRCNQKEFKTRFKYLIKHPENEKVNRFQIYGERASGTNFLKQLLIKNILNIEPTNQYGWKHFFPPEDFPNSEKCLFVVIYRDPFDWLRSIYLQPHHVHDSLKKLSFSAFIRKEWYCVWDEKANVLPDDERYGKEMMFERDQKTKERFQNVLKLRSAKIKAFEELRELVSNVEYVKYEELRDYPNVFLAYLSKKYDIPLKSNFESISTYKGITNKVFIPKKYFDIERADLTFIKNQLNVKLEKSIGYSFSDFQKKNIATFQINSLKDLFIQIKNSVVKRM